MATDKKFNGLNWLTFKTTVLAAAKVRRILGYREGTIIPPTPDPAGKLAPTTVYWGSTNPNTEEWCQHDTYAQSLVTLNVQHDTKLDLALLNAKEALSNIQYSKGEDMGTHIAAMCTAWSRANAQGASINDTKFCMLVLKSMLALWAILVSTLAHETMSAAVIMHLSLHASQVKTKSTTPIGQLVQALSTQSNGRCGGIHNPHLQCNNCRQKGHMAPECFHKGGKASQFPDWWKRSSPTGPTAPSPVTNSTVAQALNPMYLAPSTTTSPEANNDTFVMYADSAASWSSRIGETLRRTSQPQRT
ncbi:hypothetical protein C0991_005352 [Blastosporella zonata]|nr:hypothetical protein C0991_005352 [Blastosporella zonata]